MFLPHFSVLKKVGNYYYYYFGYVKTHITLTDNSTWERRKIRRNKSKLYTKKQYYKLKFQWKKKSH